MHPILNYLVPPPLWMIDKLNWIKLKSVSFSVDEQISCILDICRTDEGKASVKVFYDVSTKDIEKSFAKNESEKV